MTSTIRGGCTPKLVIANQGDAVTQASTWPVLKEASAISPAPIYAFEGEHGDDNTSSILPMPIPKKSSRLQGILKGWGSRMSSGDTEASMPVGLKVVRIREPNRGSLGAVRN